MIVGNCLKMLCDLPPIGTMTLTFFQVLLAPIERCRNKILSPVTSNARSYIFLPAVTKMDGNIPICTLFLSSFELGFAVCAVHLFF